MQAMSLPSPAVWPCDLGHLWELVTQLGPGVACLGLERELQGQGSHRTLGGLHPTPEGGCPPTSQPSLAHSSWPVPQRPPGPSCPGLSALSSTALRPHPCSSPSQDPGGPAIRGTLCPHRTPCKLPSLPGSHLRRGASIHPGSPAPNWGVSLCFTPPSALSAKSCLALCSFAAPSSWPSPSQPHLPHLPPESAPLRRRSPLEPGEQVQVDLQRGSLCLFPADS